MHVITTQKELETVLAAFEKSDFVTVDTEFIRETTFWPILCLIQMAAPGVTALIDPLSPDIDLAPFFKLMANEAVVKVFHAARQDIEIIVHLGDLVPHPVFDTQVAAMVCGFGDSVSYDQLVQRITGARLDKSSRFLILDTLTATPQQGSANLNVAVKLNSFVKAEAVEPAAAGAL